MRWGVFSAHNETAALQMEPCTWHIIALTMFRKMGGEAITFDRGEKKTERGDK